MLQVGLRVSTIRVRPNPLSSLVELSRPHLNRINPDRRLNQVGQAKLVGEPSWPKPKVELSQPGPKIKPS